MRALLFQQVWCVLSLLQSQKLMSSGVSNLLQLSLCGFGCLCVFQVICLATCEPQLSRAMLVC